MTAKLYTAKLGNNADQWAVIDEARGADKAITLNDRGGQFAALIAAAPDLLQALEVITLAGSPETMKAAIDYARIVIAKVKGE